jgi:transposase InsO family protein
LEPVVASLGTTLRLRCNLALRHLDRRVRKTANGVRLLVFRWLHDLGEPAPGFRGARAWNRTPRDVEEEIVRLHVAHPQLGAGQLRLLVERVLGVVRCRETFRAILMRNRDVIARLQGDHRKTPRRIVVSRPLQLWGIDLTLVRLFAIWPVWLVGVVDLYGSRLIALEPVLAETSAEVYRVLEAAFAREGTPARLLSDNGPQFTSAEFASFLAGHGVEHTRTRPWHPWTNGRIERLFGTFKSTVFGMVWFILGRRQLERFCADFRVFYNRDRPHSAWGGRTPDEVWFRRRKRIGSLGAVSYFDGLMPWHRFG